MDIKDAIQLKGARLQILIQEKTPLGDFHDAIYYGPAEVEHIASEQEITDAVTRRVTDWVAFVEEQSHRPPYVPTKDELKDSASSQADQITAVTAQLVAASPTREEAQAIIDKLQTAIDGLKSVTAAEVGAEEIVP